MRHSAFAGDVSRDDLLAWYRRNRVRTRELFDLVVPGAYFDRPIALRNPIVFYEGHLPAFSVNTLVKLTKQRSGIDERLETLFARGIDPADEAAAASPTEVWPSREEVQAYARAADALVEEHLTEPSEAAFTILEHEAMHHETLLYMLHELEHEKKIWSAAAVPPLSKAAANAAALQIPAGTAKLGTDASLFGWDNEFHAHTVDVPAFTIDSHAVTNGEYLEFLRVTGAKAPHFLAFRDGEWFFRGMFAMEPLERDAPVWVTHDEAAAYARWKGARLLTEAEWHRAYDSGVPELTGHGWEWTSTLFAPYAGFAAMKSYPEYSADFFDDAHYVMKGASPVTPRELIRPGFRNWFRPAYPYVYATFRLAR
ncbi:MAG TPA: SUMF1/EgtB/PvdO family nonheme iron enzyme [Thermoanaerobaculia bacterium]|jgi:formylglycine-generating enzyme required for sulfatase activity